MFLFELEIYAIFRCFQDAWQEWDWEEDLWDEASEWDEYITVKDVRREDLVGGP